MAAGLLLVRSWEYRQLSPSLQRPCMKYLETQKNKGVQLIGDVRNMHTRIVIENKTLVYLKISMAK